MMRVQMLGLCRFSYLGGRGFQVRHESIEERRAFLYDPERLERRWFWFQNVALPGWREQTDPDFTLVIMTGPDLPEPWLSRLRDVAAAVPQIRLELVPPLEAHLEACLAAIRPHRESGADVIGHFRHDDDDAVAVDFIETARRDFALAKDVWQRKRKLCCDYSRGVVLKGTARGVEVDPWVIYNTGIAQPIFMGSEIDQTALHLPHWKIGLSMPNLLLSEKLMFARFLHHDNDSGAIGAGYRAPIENADWKQLLARRFRMDLDLLNRGAQEFGKGGASRPRWGR